MNGTRIHDAGGLENPIMTPADTRPVAKRKAPDDISNPLLAATAKKTKKEVKANGKRKLIGEEQPGGLVIVRAPAPRPLSPQNHPSSQPVLGSSSRPPSRPPSSLSQPLPSTSAAATPGPSQPPSKKLKVDSLRGRTGAKSRDVLATTREDPELDDDVRQMEDETDDLRRRSRAKESINQSFQFPPSTSKPPSQRNPPDTLQPLPECETPLIERNKLLRGGQPVPQRGPRTPQAQAQTPRRSSMSMRGKRISTSFENTGVISQPHASVNDSSFYKHIDCDLPEPQRARQLLVWSAARALTRLSEGSPSSAKSSKPPSKGSHNSHGKDPPPLLDENQKEVLKAVQEDFIRMLAEKRIDVSVYARDKTPVGGSLKPNEQNVKNRAREVTFQQHIDRAQAEAEAWQRVDHFYHTYEVNSKSELESRRQAFKPPSARAKGKQRATSEGPSDDWLWLMPTDDALSEDFKSRVNLQVVKDVMASEPQAGEVHKDSLDNEIDDLRFKLDSLFSYVSTAVHMVNIVESELDHRFSLLSHALSARSRSLPPPAPSSSTSLSSHLPLLQRGGSHPPGESPRDVLRALSRIDKERPPGKIGDAARRAVREVQRVHEGGTSGAGERRITGLPPGVGATPRKVPGTPRRR